MIRALGQGWRCINRAPGLCPAYPREFQWASRSDDEGLKNYIDLVLTERTTEARAIEALGMVTDVVADTTTEPPAAYVPPRALLDVLLLRDPARIPFHQGLRLYHAHTTKGKLVVFPGDIPLAMARLYGSLEGGKNPTVLDRKGIPSLGITRADMHSGFYLDHPELAPRIIDDEVREMHERGAGPASGPAGASAAPAVPPRENLLQHDASGQAVIALSEVISTGGAPDYYVRRVVAIDTGELAYVATSYHRNGPWHVWERDNSLLLRLRVTPD
jgi:hypothetical protein